MARQRLLLAAACLAAASAGSARGDTPAGRIHGFVVGPDGARLPGVTLTLREAATGMEVRFATGELGLFQSPDLAPGFWDIRAELPGFAPGHVQGVEVEAGRDRPLDLVLATVKVTEYVTVTGAVPRDSLEAPRIRESGARDVGEALGAVAGVTKVRKGGIANEVVLRGLQSRDLSVLVDGQRVHGACPNHMDPAAFHVDFAEVDRVEVGKGPFDVQNQGSLGGTVNVITKAPERGWHATPQLSAGSFGFVNPSLTLARGAERLSALGGFSWRRSDAYRDGSGQPFTASANYRPGAAEGDAFDVGTGWGRLVLAPSEGHRIDLAYTAQRSDAVYYPYLSMDAGWDDMDRANLRYEGGRPGDAVRVSAQGYWARVDHWMDDRLRVSSAGTPRGYSMGTMARTRTWGGRLQAAHGGTTAGLEGYSRSWDATNEMAGMGYRPQDMIPDVTVEVVGLFVEHNRTLRPGWQLDLGGRLDRAWSAADGTRANTDLYQAYHSTRSTSARDTLPSAKARLTWRHDGFETTAGIGHAERVPEPNERYLALRRKGTDWVGDPGLVPSRNTGLDASFSWERRGVRASVCLFQQRVSDYIAVVPAARTAVVPGVMNSQARSFANVDATLRGGELATSVALGSRVFLTGDLSYTRGTQAADPGRGIAGGDLAEMPPLAGRAGLRFDDGRLFAALEGVFAGRQGRVDAALQEEPTPGWAIANVRAGLRWRKVLATVGVANLFDRDYVEHLSYQRDPFRTGAVVPEPGRNVYVNASMRF
jgi:iron complex outermembrane receptor protein